MGYGWSDDKNEDLLFQEDFERQTDEDAKHLRRGEHSAKITIIITAVVIAVLMFVLWNSGLLKLLR